MALIKATPAQLLQVFKKEILYTLAVRCHRIEVQNLEQQNPQKPILTVN
jgi:hypothetical protein